MGVFPLHRIACSVPSLGPSSERGIRAVLAVVEVVFWVSSARVCVCVCVRLLSGAFLFFGVSNGDSNSIRLVR